MNKLKNKFDEKQRKEVKKQTTPYSFSNVNRQIKNSPFKKYHYYNQNNYNDLYYGFENRNRYFQQRPHGIRNFKNFGGNNVVRKKLKKSRSRPSSPLYGTEEYTQKKIQETSDMIKKKLLMPFDESENVDENREEKNDTDTILKTSSSSNREEQKDKSIFSSKTRKISDKSVEKNSTKVHYDIGEIHSKIINHISNLNYGKKMNLIQSDKSGYDNAIQQIYKQKSLELSKALRDLCSEKKPEASEVVNSIIPDFDIKLEELPLEIIEQLSTTFNVDEYSNQQFFFSNFNSSQHDFSNREYVYNNTIPNDNTTEANIAESYSRVKIENDEFVDNSTNIFPKYNLSESQISTQQEGLDQDKIDNFESLNNFIEPAHNLRIGNFNSSENEFSNREFVFNNSMQNDCSTTETNIAESNCGVKIENDKNAPTESFDSFTEILPKPNLSENQISTQQEGLDQDRIDNFESLDNLIEPIPDNFRIRNDIFTGELDQNNFAQGDCFVPAPKDFSYMIQQNDFSCPPPGYQPFPLCQEPATNTLVKNKISYNNLDKLFVDCWTQTDNDKSSNLSEFKLENPNSLKEAVEVMFTIDKEIERLTKLRQNIFIDMNNQETEASQKENERSQVSTKRKHSELSSENIISSSKVFDGNLDFRIPSKVLAIQMTKHELVLGMENGTIMYFSLTDGRMTRTLEVTNVAITTLVITKIKEQNQLFVGSLDSCLKSYDVESTKLLKSIDLIDSIQCVEVAWGCLFLGGSNGVIFRYSLTKEKIEFEDRMSSSSSILVLKATKEGARKVLLVGSKNSPVCIRDAMSGLHMRTLYDLVFPTVYSLVLENSKVYCGTPFHDIRVYNFHDGNIIKRLKSSNSKGVGCMKVVKNLLFASCHDGFIYIFDKRSDDFIQRIQGPGGVILSMEIFDQVNKIFIGTLSTKFQAIDIPQEIMDLNC